MTDPQPFWKTTSLSQMSRAQWESLCDGCAKCCLQKIEDDDDGQVYYTDLHCRYLHKETCQCTIYTERSRIIPQCITLTFEHLELFDWLPDTCAYRLLSEGKDLPQWHPLVSGSSTSVHDAGISVKHMAMSDEGIPCDDWPDHIIYKAV